MLKRRAAFCAVITVLALNLSLSAYAAPVFIDVDSAHLAYDSIIRMADAGFIVGDTSGRYNPNGFIGKFDTAKILARIAGFKQTDYTEAEKTFFDRAYEKNRDYLAQFSKTYKRWDTTADRQIAYLLEKEILTPNDLNNFIGKKEDGTEGVRALTKEDAVMFAVKTLGKKSEALSTVIMTLYVDNNKISAAARPYVYYAKAAGIFPSDSKTFDPRDAITKADMAVLLDKLCAFTGFNIKEASAAQGGGSIESLTAEITAIYDTNELSAVQLTTPDSTKKLYRISKDAVITIDGFLKTKTDLVKGATVDVVLNNNEIISITSGVSNTSADGAILTAVNGIVLSIADDPIAKTITIEAKIQEGTSAATEVKSYILSEKCEISREGENVSFGGINQGDMITAEVSGTKAYSVKLTDKSHLLEADFVSAARNIHGVVLFTVMANDKERTLTLDSLASVTRNGDKCTWQKLKTGDILSLTCDYDKITAVLAYGIKSEVTGKITQIMINESASYITILQEDKETEYKINPERIDVYSLRPGAIVTAALDSKEAELIYKITDALNGASRLTGYVTVLRDSSIVINNIKNKTADTTEFKITSSTIFTDLSTGKLIDFKNIEIDAKIYVTLDETLKTALFVTVL